MVKWTTISRPLPHGERRDQLGEGITYGPEDDGLYWVDILGQRVQRFGLTDGTYREWAMPEMIGWLLPRANGRGFIAGLKSGFYDLSLDPFSLRLIAAPEPDLPDNRLNDAAVDPQGHIWAGTMCMGGTRVDGAL